MNNKWFILPSLVGLIVLGGCSSTPSQVETTSVISTADADAAMKAGALAAASQVMDLVSQRNDILSVKPEPTSTPSASPSTSTEASLSPSTSEESSPSAAPLVVVPDNLNAAKSKFDLLDTSNLLTGYNISSIPSAGFVQPESIDFCVQVGRLPSAISGTQDAWVVWVSGSTGRTSILPQGVVSCAAAAAKSIVPTPTPSSSTLAQDAQVLFPQWVDLIPPAQLTPLGKTATTYPTEILVTLAKGTPLSAVTSPGWVPPTPSESPSVTSSPS